MILEYINTYINVNIVMKKMIDQDVLLFAIYNGEYEIENCKHFPKWKLISAFDKNHFIQNRPISDDNFEIIVNKKPICKVKINLKNHSQEEIRKYMENLERMKKEGFKKYKEYVEALNF